MNTTFVNTTFAQYDYTFKRMLEQRAQGVVYNAAPEQSPVGVGMGYGETLKQARANAVGYYAAFNAPQALLYSFVGEE